MEGDRDPASPQASDTPVDATPPPPSEPPPYTPAASSVYSPAPVATPTQVPPVYEQQFGAPFAPYAPPPVMAPRRNRGRMLLVIGAIVLVVLAALGGGAVFANAQLSSTYSPQRAVSDYFAAMARGDVGGMMNNATLLAGDSTYSQFFGRDELTAMMNVDQNKQISDVKIDSVSSLSSSTSSVNVSLSWGGTARNLTYQVQKDTSRVHYLFYDSWRVQVPFTTISVSLPNQPGGILVDGQALSSTAGGKFEAIQGFHKVEMAQSNFYDSVVQTVDGVDATGTIAITAGISASARAAAADAVRGAFANTTCDTTYWDCPNHQYHGAFILPAPGGDITTNTGWVLVYEGDPTTGMKLTVTTTTGLVTGIGICAMKLTVDGSRVYHFVGTWTGKLTWANGGFGSDLTSYCDAARA